MLRAVQHAVANVLQWSLSLFSIPQNLTNADGGWFYHPVYNEIWAASWPAGYVHVERYDATTGIFIGYTPLGDATVNPLYDTTGIVYDDVNNVIYAADSSFWDLKRYSGVDGSFISKDLTELPYLPSIDPYLNTAWSGSANASRRVIRFDVNGVYVQHWDITPSIGFFYLGGMTFSPTHTYVTCLNYGSLHSINKTTGVVTELRPPQDIGNRYKTISYDETRNILWCTVYGNNNQIRKFDLNTNTEVATYTLPFAAYPQESLGANVHERVYDPTHDVLIVSSFYYAEAETGELAILSASDPSTVLFHEFVAGYSGYGAPTHYQSGDCIWFKNNLLQYRKVCLTSL